MRIVVKDLPERPVRLSGTAEIALAEDLQPAIFVRAPVGYDLNLNRDGSTVQVEGHVEASVEASCSRCAKRFPIAIDRTFEEVFASASERQGVLPTELDAKDLDLDYYEGDAIDGLQLLAEQILLGLPMKILCVEQCKGLCAKCGADLNQTECDCKADADPRWASLEGLRDRL